MPVWLATSLWLLSTANGQPSMTILELRSGVEGSGAATREWKRVVEVQGLIARPEDFAAFNEAYAKFFPTDPPVRSRRLSLFARLSWSGLRRVE